MPNSEKKIEEHMQEAIDRFDVDCKSNDKKWDELDTAIQNDLILLAEIGEAVCRVSSSPQTDDADTNLAWERMKVRKIRSKGTKTHKLRIAYYVAVVVAATFLLIFLVTKPEGANSDISSVPILSQRTNISDNKINNAQVATDTTTAKPTTAASKTATINCTAMVRRSMGNAMQLIMELQNQGYAVDGQIQRSSQPVQPGEFGKVLLPDGTEAYLYTSSKLTYPSAFVGDTRDVILEGEAYFKVTHDALHPFIIHTAHVATRVLGTELNVCAYQGEPLHVALIDGVAEVVRGNDVCRLKPGEGVTMLNGNMCKQQEDMETYAYALRGYIYADDMPLESVMTTLAHWYGMKVSFIDRKYANQRIHFYMSSSELPDKAAELLNTMGSFNVTIKGDCFVVN